MREFGWFYVNGCNGWFADISHYGILIHMGDKEAFLRRSKRLRWVLAAFVSVYLFTLFIEPDLVLMEWAIFLPFWGCSVSKLRCWSCGDRLLKNGGSEIEYCRVGLLNWDMCRHKTCGATLH